MKEEILINEHRDFNVDSKTLIITLTSYNKGRKITETGSKEWYRVLTFKYKHLLFKKWFIADVNNSFWHTTYPGISGHGPIALSKYILNVLSKIDVDNICIMGLSMGGYGAFLIGCLINSDVAIAYSPQTWLTYQRYTKNNLHKKFDGLNITKEQTDLKIFLEKNNNKKTIYHLFYGTKNKNDTNHAERIKDINGVILHPVDSSIHTVAKPLIKNGVVEKILKNVINKKYIF